MPARLFETIAEKLEKQIRKNPDKPLPTVSELAAQWEVSHVTMGKAIDVLRKKGIVECFWGKGIRPVGGKPRIQSQAHGKLYEELKWDILHGDRRAGDELPKTTYFTTSYGVSTHTVGRALKVLSEENLVHKQGKRWIVGPKRKSPAMMRTDDRPVVLFATPWETMMNNFFTNKFAQPFVTSLLGEFQKYGIRIVFVTMYKLDQEFPSESVSLEDTVSLVRKLGSRYLGTLYHTGLNPSTQMQWEHWIPRLYSFGQPVAIIDTSNQHVQHTRAHFSVGPRYYRFYIDDRAAVSCALEHLYEHNHRRVGLPISGQSDWIVRRTGYLIETAKKLPGMSIETVEQNEPFWAVSEKKVQTGIRFLAKEMENVYTGKRLSMQKLAREVTPSLRHLLDDKITALISVNDEIALKHSQWIRLAGLEIPRHVSHVSFDNTPATTPHLLSSVDFGFSRLGYLAAHLYIGDLPIKADKEGGIVGKCAMVDKGSVGRIQSGS